MFLGIELFYCLILFICVKMYSILSKGRCTSFACLVGKTAIITGGNAGIGYQVALALASRGCKVIIADIADTSTAKAKIIQETGNQNIVGRYLNLASFKSVREFAQGIKKTESRIDYLINNAGIGCSTFKKTEDGLLDIMQVNLFSHFLLTHLLIDLLKTSAPSKIIFTSSFASILGGFSLNQLEKLEVSGSYKILVEPYSTSKFAINVAAALFSEKLRNSGVTCNPVHPGIVRTNLYRNNCHNMKGQSKFTEMMAWTPSIVAHLFGKNAEEGSQTIVHIVCSKDINSVSGKFFADCSSSHWMTWLNTRKYSQLPQEFRKDFWALCEELAGLQDNEKLTDLRDLTNFG